MSKAPEMNIDKKDLTEEEIKTIYIDPAVYATWSKNNVRKEYYITNGRIFIDGKKTRRGDKGFADYLLFHYGTGNWFPIAVLEAKDNNSSVIGGMRREWWSEYWR